MKIAFISDVHLDDVRLTERERRISILNDIEADYLILAGDICSNRYTTFYFDMIKPKVKKIIVVKGNHEFYHNDLDYLATYPKHVVCLEADKPFVDGEFVFIGDTLWTDVPEEQMNVIERYMNDYILITKNGEDIGCDVTNDIHKEHLGKLEATVNAHLDKRIIMGSHHSPSFEGVSPRFACNMANAGFHSNAIENFVGKPIEVWIHGHTHDGLDYDFHGINVRCNPWGYMHERSGVVIEYIDL